MKTEKPTRLDRLLQTLERRIDETQGTPREWHYRAIENGAYAALAAINMDDRAAERKAAGE